MPAHHLILAVILLALTQEGSAAKDLSSTQRVTRGPGALTCETQMQGREQQNDQAKRNPVVNKNLQGACL
jgi:hypothetical protein